MLVRTRRAVLATVPAPTLYEHLIAAEHLPTRLLHDLRGFHWDDATVKVDWALSRPIPWLNPAAGAAGTVHLAQDPTRSAAGTEAAWAYTLVPRGLRWTHDDACRYADRMERIVERHAPGFTAAIMSRSVSGPDDLARRDANLVGGALNAGTSAIHQQLFFRPIPGLGRADTPIDRLYLAGASAHPGGAVHGGPGANAARAALARSGIGSAGYRWGMRRLQELIYS